MNKICQKLVSVVKNTGKRGLTAVNNGISGSVRRLIPGVAVNVIPGDFSNIIPEIFPNVIPEGRSRESQPCKTTKRPGLPNPAGRQALGGDGAGDNRLGFLTETLGGDGGHTKRVRAAGFTLIELLVVVLIIGILAAVALPQYQKAVMRSRAAEALIMLDAFREAEKRYYLANGSYTEDLGALDIKIPDGKFFRYYATTTDDAGPRIYAVSNTEPFLFEFSLGSNARWCMTYDSNIGHSVCRTFGKYSHGPQDGNGLSYYRF